MNWITKIIKAGEKIKTAIHKRASKEDIANSDWTSCCKGPILKKDLEENLWVCPDCNKHHRINPKQRFDILFGKNNYEIFKTPIPKDDPLNWTDSKSYKDRLKSARKKTGMDCGMMVVSGSINDIKITAVASDFDFLGASMAAAEGEAFLYGIQHAIENQNPFLCISAGGGMRMMESLISLSQMSRTSLAINELKKNNLPYLVCITDPTAGGITASYAMLGDIHIAEPGALIAFAGARVIQGTVKEELPQGFQKSEYVEKTGFVDIIIERKDLCEKLGNPQDKIKAINVVGTNGKNSTIQACYSILKEANIKCNVYTSPHIQKVNERFVFNNQEVKDDELADLFEEVEKVNNNQPITFFEILTACYFYKAAQYPKNINLVESGLFFRFDATNILKKNLATIITSISKDHLDWLPKNDQTIEKIVFEKTSNLLDSNIIVAKQNQNTMDLIKKNISKNKSNKIYFNEDFSFTNRENGYFYYEDKFGGLKLPEPNVLGLHQLENISTAIVTLRTLDFDIKDENIKLGLQKINNIARLQEITTGNLKNLVKDNLFLISGDHNEDGARVLNEYLQSLDCNKHLIIGMMANKDHESYIGYLKNVSSITTVDIPSQPNAIRGKKLKDKFKHLPNVKYAGNIEEAIKSIEINQGDLLLITGSLYLCSEVLKLN